MGTVKAKSPPLLDVEKKYRNNERGDKLILLRTAMRETGLSEKEFVSRADKYAEKYCDKKGRPYAPSTATLNLRMVHGVIPKGISKENFDALVLAVANSFEVIRAWASARGIKNGYLLGRDPNARLDGNGRVIKTKINQHTRTKTVAGDIFLQMEAKMLDYETLNHFNLKQNPFEDSLLSADSLWLSKSMRAAMGAMETAAKTGGLMAVISEVGSGKSIVRRKFYDAVKNDSRIMLITVQAIDKRHLHTSNIYRAIVRDLTADEAPASNREQAARQVKRLLAERVNSGIRPVLVFEEAHDLPDDVLRYLKRFHELGDEGFRKLSAIILVGQTELGTRLAPGRGYHLREVAQRLQRIEIKPLGNEMTAYMDYRFKLAGAKTSQVFDDSAIREMRAALKTYGSSNGRKHDANYPLAVNNLATAAMNVALQVGATRVTKTEIMGAVRECQGGV